MLLVAASNGGDRSACWGWIVLLVTYFSCWRQRTVTSLFSNFLLAFLLQLPSVITFHFLVLFNVSHFSFFLLPWLFCFPSFVSCTLSISACSPKSCSCYLWHVLISFWFFLLPKDLVQLCMRQSLHVSDWHKMLFFGNWRSFFLVKCISPRRFCLELMLFLVCREVLLILSAFQLCGREGGRNDLPRMSEGKLVIEWDQYSSPFCPPYANNRQLSVRDREKGKPNRQRSKKKGRRETLKNQEKVAASNRRKLCRKVQQARGGHCKWRWLSTPHL